MATDPTCGDYSYKSRQKFEGQPPWPPLSPSHKPWKPTWVHSHSAFSTDLLQLPRGLLNVKKLLKRISSLCQKECANLFLYQQLKVHFFLWGVCVCFRVCVRVRHRTDLSPGGWLSCFRVYQLPMAKVKVTLRVYFLKNITTGKAVNGIIFGHLFFLFSDLSNIVPLKGLHYYYYYERRISNWPWVFSHVCDKDESIGMRFPCHVF